MNDIAVGKEMIGAITIWQIKALQSHNVSFYPYEPGINYLFEYRRIGEDGKHLMHFAKKRLFFRNRLAVDHDYRAPGKVKG